VVTHPSLEKSEGWGTPAVRVIQGCATRQLKGKYYIGGKPVAYYTTAASSAGAATHFEHQDWLGTERMRTTYNGGVEGTYTSLPFGDGQSTVTGTDLDANHYAMLDYDTETGTDHAQFRQYSVAQGRWLAPDPYSGSYDTSNPQSMNRYVYALNNPLSYIDPSGLILCDYGINDETGKEDYDDADTDYECIHNGGTVVSDTTSVTANGNNPSDPGITIENGLSIYPTITFYGGPVVAPNNATPWYKNPCVQSALAKGAGSAALDAIGLLPEGGAVSAAFSLWHGAAGVSNGTKLLQGVKVGGGIITTASSGSDGNWFGGVTGALSIGASLAKAAPVYGQVLSGISLAGDAYSTYKAVAGCQP
jgi:RHS repeat-associated protein